MPSSITSRRIRQTPRRECGHNSTTTPPAALRALIDFLQLETSRQADGVIINPGALVRYGYSLRQAFIDLGKPVIEIHMSDIHKTGVNTAVNVFDGVRIQQFVGLKEHSYYEALTALINYIIT